MNWYTIVYNAFLLGAITAFLVYFFTSGVTAYGALLTAYSALAISLIMIVSNLFYTITFASTTATSLFSKIATILSANIPFVLLLGLVVYMIAILSIFQNKIVNNHVSSDFSTFNFMFVLICLLQVYVLWMNNI